MITREQAVEVLYMLINSGILDVHFDESLQEIANCIEAEEELGLHIWGAPSEDVSILYTSKRTDLPEYNIFVQHQKAIAEKYSFEKE